MEKTIFLPAGYSATIISDEFSSGTYTRITQGGSHYIPLAFNASATTTFGPFSEPRDYKLDWIGNDLSISIDPAASEYGYFNYTKINAPGAGSFIPNAATTKMLVQIIGAGAGGWTKLETDSSHAFIASAGGNGAFVEMYISEFIPGYEFGYDIGAGGAAASANNLTPPDAGEYTRFGNADLSEYIEAGGGSIGDNSGLLTAATESAILANGENGIPDSTALSDFTAEVINASSNPSIPLSVAWIAGTDAPLLNDAESYLINTDHGKGGYPKGSAESSALQNADPGVNGCINIYEFG